MGSAVDQIELSQLVSSCVNAQKEKKKREKYVSVPSLIVVVVVVSLSFLGQKDKGQGGTCSCSPLIIAWPISFVGPRRLASARRS